MREAIEVAPGTWLRVGEALPGRTPPVEIRRLERTDGRPAETAQAGELSAAWGTADRGAVIPVSEVVGQRTIPHRLVLEPDANLAVGSALEVDGLTLHIWGLRARSRTWQRPGDVFPARDVQRVYARRYRMPPAGSSDWSVPRGSPSSRASSTSRLARSRSSPGVKIRRTRPRAASAAGGATTQSSSDS